MLPDCPAVNIEAITAVTSSPNCSCGPPAPADVTLCLQTGDWVEISFDVLQLLTGMRIAFSGGAEQNQVNVLLEYRDAQPDWHTINVTGSNRYAGGFPLVGQPSVLTYEILIYDICIATSELRPPMAETPGPTLPA